MIGTVLAVSFAHAEDIPVSFSVVDASSTAVGSTPTAVFGPGAWRADPEAEFVELRMVADAPISVRRVAVIHCDGWQEAGAAKLFIDGDHIDGRYEGLSPVGGSSAPASPFTCTGPA